MRRREVVDMREFTIGETVLISAERRDLEAVVTGYDGDLVEVRVSGSGQTIRVPRSVICG